MPEQWVKNIVENTLGGSPVEKGKTYLHPVDGPIKITSGQYWGAHGLSNFWHWTILSTGEPGHGYGENWPEVAT